MSITSGNQSCPKLAAAGPFKLLIIWNQGAIVGVSRYARYLPEVANRPGAKSSSDIDLSRSPLKYVEYCQGTGCILRKILPRKENALNILLVDDHELFRAGMRYLLRRLDAELKLDEANDCAVALERLAAQSYDLVLLDLGMPCLSGIDALDALRDVAPGTPLVVISGEENPAVVRASIEHGAMGFIPKSSTPEVLIHALELVLSHGVYLPRAVLYAAQSAPAPSLPQAGADRMTLPGLTKRQAEVLRGVIVGKTNKAIAQELKLSDATVKAHLTLIFRALGVNSRTEAIYAAAKLGLRLA